MPTDIQTLWQMIIDHLLIAKVKGRTCPSSDTKSQMKYWHKQYLQQVCRRLIATWKKLDKAAVWHEKPLHGALHKNVPEFADTACTYQWLNKSNIRANTKTLIMEAQEQALNTRAVSNKICHTVQNPRYRLCKQHAKTVARITSGCSKLTKTEYTDRHNNVASIIHRAMCPVYNFEHSKDC